MLFISSSVRVAKVGFTNEETNVVIGNDMIDFLARLGERVRQKSLGRRQPGELITLAASFHRH